MTDYQTAFDAIVRDPRYLARLDWGQPRAGHPEGTIRAHILELERNLELLRPRLTEPDYWKLKLLVHTHDTFKPDADPNAEIVGPASHASLARCFLAEYCADRDLLAMAQFHDEPYALWRQVESKGRYDMGRLAALVSTIKDWNLFLAFAMIDGCTPGKSREPLRWFFNELRGKVKSAFTVDDLP